MMVIDQDGVGRLEGFLAQEPSAGVLQCLGFHCIEALAHGRETEIGAVGDDGGE